MRFDQKCVVITGAGQGLGEAFAKAFALEGASVALVGRTIEKLQRVEKAITDQGGTAASFQCDIAEEKSVLAMHQEVEKRFGAVDILINNAAFHQSVAVVDTSYDLWRKQIETNLTGTFLCTKAVLPQMIARSYGKIVNISSSAAKHFFPGFGAYAASKGGIVSFTHTLSEEVKHKGINVNAIYLGMTDTEHTRERMNEDKAVSIPLDQMLSVEDVVPVVLFLASEDAKAIMGAAIDVFGRKS